MKGKGSACTDSVRMAKKRSHDDIVTVSKTIILSSLESLDVFQKVTVNIKVVEQKEETQVGGRVKRDVCVAVRYLEGERECDGK